MSKPELNEDIVRLVLLRNKGDLIRSAGELTIRPSTLVRWIRSVPSVANLWQEMELVKADPAFDNATAQQFEAEIKARATVYRLDGLEVLHELATTGHDGVSSMAEVRLKAAIELRSSTEFGSTGGGNVLAELNELYRVNAPRIRSMRAVEILYDDQPASLPLPG